MTVACTVYVINRPNMQILPTILEVISDILGTEIRMKFHILFAIITS